jgi:hypothetical protein
MSGEMNFFVWLWLNITWHIGEWWKNRRCKHTSTTPKLMCQKKKKQ